MFLSDSGQEVTLLVTSLKNETLFGASLSCLIAHYL